MRISVLFDFDRFSMSDHLGTFTVIGDLSLPHRSVNATLLTGPFVVVYFQNAALICSLSLNKSQILSTAALIKRVSFEQSQLLVQD